MKKISLLYCIIILSVAQNTYAQILKNNCDSTILTLQEFEKCKLDQGWDKDIMININFVSSLKTELLPKYRRARESLIVLRTCKN